ASHLNEEWAYEGSRSAMLALAVTRPVVKYDHRNGGLSDHGALDFTLDAHVADLEAVVDTVTDGTVALYASLFMARVALRYAAEHPDRVERIALAAPSIRRDDGQGVVEGLDSLWEIERQNYKLFTDIWATVYYGLDDAEGAAFSARLFRATSDADEFRRSIAALNAADVTSLLPDVKCPALVLQGEGPEFRIELAREMVASMPAAEMFIHGSPGMTFWYPEYVHKLADFFRLSTSALQPSEGFQTILFTDLESSTALTQRVGDEAAQEVLRGHNSAVRGALEANGGREVKHTGDGIMASFPSAVSAVQAALAIQRALEGGEVRVRVGLNAGEPIAEDDDLFGTAVQLAARIVDRAEPGQVLVSNVVRELCAGKTFEFTSIGEATLKGFDEPVTLYEVRVEQRNGAGV
ncbi:MAG: adenylate/guanylate cyclase domain-containing protein, partial [Dehalococcoidia bacterium]